MEATPGTSQAPEDNETIVFMEEEDPKGVDNTWFVVLCHVIKYLAMLGRRQITLVLLVVH